MLDRLRKREEIPISSFKQKQTGTALNFIFKSMPFCLSVASMRTMVMIMMMMVTVCLDWHAHIVPNRIKSRAYKMHWQHHRTCLSPKHNHSRDARSRNSLTFSYRWWWWSVFHRERESIYSWARTIQSSN